jgi:MOSC domain-containing protein YiiM
MRVISVNVGVPRDVAWKGITVRTSIFKEPVAGMVIAGKLNLCGDAQADLTVHGGEQKAVYAYPAEHYEYWKMDLGQQLSWGSFGENLTTEGIEENGLAIGDRLRIGSALVMVTQPRMPCYKLNLRFGRDDMIKRFLMSGRPGFYFSVAEVGELTANSHIEIVTRDPNKVTVADVGWLYLNPSRDRNLLERALNVAALPADWKVALQRKHDAGR